MKKHIDPKYICVDFDGTCVYHEFPKVGADAPGAVQVLKELVDAGHKLILFTMRSDVDDPLSTQKGIVAEPGQYLQHAIDWFAYHEIPLFGIQRNPTQNSWTSSPKAYGHIYIDDAALGCPLLKRSNHDRPYVDWAKVRELLKAAEVLPEIIYEEHNGLRLVPGDVYFVSYGTVHLLLEYSHGDAAQYYHGFCIKSWRGTVMYPTTNFCVKSGIEEFREANPFEKKMFFEQKNK